MTRPSTLAIEAALLAQPPRPDYRLRYLGDPVLEQKCAKIESKADIPAGLVEAMYEILYKARGIGLSAPQVGVPIQLAILGERLLVINPVVTRTSPETNTDMEGCLSIPNFFHRVKRPSVITMAYKTLTPEGIFEHKQEVLRGMSARIACHEIDHLNGKLILEGASRQVRRQAARHVQKALERLGVTAPILP